MPKEPFIPIKLVEKLAAEGKTEPEIIQSLRAHGFTPSQIDKALKSALKAAVERPQPLLRPAVGAEEVSEEKIVKPVEFKPIPSGPKPMSQAEKALVPPELRTAEFYIEEGAPVPEKIPVQLPIKNEPPANIIITGKPALPEAHPIRPSPLAVEPTTQIRAPEIKHEITLEELVEEVVDEHEKKIESQINEIEHREHEIQQRLTIIEDNFHKFQTALDNHMKGSETKLSDVEKIMESFDARFGALESAFKDFAKFMKRE